MQNTKRVRASDKHAFYDTKESGFVVRKQAPAAAISNVLMFVSLIVAGTAILMYYNSVYGAVLAVGVGGVFNYVGRKLQAQEALQNSTEFMNALFAAAIGDGYKFCAIVRRDGEIVYVNRAFQDVFPTFLEQPKRNIKVFVALSKVVEEDGKKILSQVESGTAGTVITRAGMGPDSKLEQLSIALRPISRPKGFVLLRGE